MGAPRYLAGLVCLGLITGCADAPESEIDAEDLNLDYETESSPDLPAPPAGADCVLLQRDTLGQVQDTDIGLGNGTDWAAGGYPATWTGPSPYDHWSLYQFDLSPVPAGSTVVLGVFSNYVSWNEESSTVRAHRITQPWDEATANWSNFTSDGTVTGWDPAVLATFDPEGVGFHSMDVTALVAGWHTGAVSNYGLLLEEDPVKLHNYFASEMGIVDWRPSLYVCYTASGTEPECQDIEALCEASSDCCEGLACIDGHCLPGAGTLPLPELTASGGLEAGCSENGTTCGGDGECCSGSCLDGLCTAQPLAGACIEPDQTDSNGAPLACNPDNPCCAGSHCIWGLCQPDEGLYGGTCSLPGEPCDVESLGQWCCWSQACIDGTCQ